MSWHRRWHHHHHHHYHHYNHLHCHHHTSCTKQPPSPLLLSYEQRSKYWFYHFCFFTYFLIFWFYISVALNLQHVMIDFVLTNNIPKTISNWIFFSIHLVDWCRHKYQNIISIPHTVYRTKTNVALILAELNGPKSQFIQQKKSNFLL